MKYIKIADLEHIIIDFVNMHNGVSYDDIVNYVGEFKSSCVLGQIVSSLVFHKCILRINSKGEIYNPNHFRNTGIFKYYPLNYNRGKHEKK
jgi:hypothetical protein